MLERNQGEILRVQNSRDGKSICWKISLCFLQIPNLFPLGNNAISYVCLSRAIFCITKQLALTSPSLVIQTAYYNTALYMAFIHFSQLIYYGNPHRYPQNLETQEILFVTKCYQPFKIMCSICFPLNFSEEFVYSPGLSPTPDRSSLCLPFHKVWISQ